MLELIDQRTNVRTATNPNSRRLFPGRRAGQPLRIPAITIMRRSREPDQTVGFLSTSLPTPANARITGDRQICPK
ncbi:hypothetical protein [Rhodococcus sp. NPDC059234]|uniref:hypothetical protein n=1 Tax=Rhodococcus sp. NPDC059234 TaxID=3346781 RepID=UPI00366B03A3